MANERDYTVGWGAGVAGAASAVTEVLSESSSFWISARAASSPVAGVAGVAARVGATVGSELFGSSEPLGTGVTGSGGRSKGGTESGERDVGGGVVGVVAGAAGGVGGMEGRSSGGRDGAGGVGGVGIAGVAVDGADPPSLAMVSSASFIRRSVAFWKISSSLVIVGKTFGRSGSLVLLTMSMRLILIGSRKGESISKLTMACLLSWSGIDYTVHGNSDVCQLCQG